MHTNVSHCAPGDRWDRASIVQDRLGVSEGTGGGAVSEAGSGRGRGPRGKVARVYVTLRVVRMYPCVSVGPLFQPFPNHPPKWIAGLKKKETGA